MSPEQTRRGKNATAQSDQYALGVVLYECVTGLKPFSGTTPYGLMHAIVSSTPKAPSAIAPGLPPAFDRLVFRAMHKDPRHRFSDVRALGAALLPWASETTRSAYAREMSADESGLARTKVVRFVLGTNRFVSLRWLAAAGIGAVSAAAVGISVHSTRHSRALSMAPAATSAFATPLASDSVRRPASPALEESPALAGATDAPAVGSATVAADLPGATAARTVSRSDSVIDRSTIFAGKLQDASPPLRLTASPSRPERGTNGAFIVE